VGHAGAMFREGFKMVGGLSIECVLMTREGLVPLSWLRPGDLVETRDAGFQPIVRIDPVDSPIKQGVDLGGGVLAAQRMLAAGWPIEMYFGYDEMLACAGDVVMNVAGGKEKTFVHVTLETPNLMRVGDFWMESHGGVQPMHPVLTRQEVAQVNRAFGCPVVRCEDVVPVVPPDVLTTFGSRAAVA